jgi:hypothetical protein
VDCRCGVAISQQEPLGRSHLAPPTTGSARLDHCKLHNFSIIA